jgi:hypothetical protein
MSVKLPLTLLLHLGLVGIAYTFRKGVFSNFQLIIKPNNKPQALTV